MRLLIDMSSLLWQSLLASKDNEFGVEVEHEGRTVHVNGWQHGYECAINHLLSVMEELDVVPVDCIFVCEGKMAKSRRKAIYNQYKEGRDSRPSLAYEQFAICRDKLCETFLNIGSQVVTQDGVEADDVLAFLARRLKGEMVILTTDGDMATLINENVSLWRGGMLTKANPYGKFSTRYVPVYKALCGDGNEYKGAAGFGPKAFEALLAWAGEPGLAALEGMIKRRTLAELIDDVKEFKPAQKILDSAEHVYQSYECALLHDEWVDTLRQPLQWKAGMVRGLDVVTDSRLYKWAQTVTLVTADNYEKAMSVLKENVPLTPAWALDIETSTPPESDEWLLARGTESKVDVFGSKLTGLSLTFGSNNQYTMYFSVDHFNTNNVTSEQVRDAVVLIPPASPIVIQNFAFEGPILFEEWGEAWKDNGWHGFLPNVIDTKVLANYVDENVSSGLKQGSALYLGYKQASYAEVTGGRKMNQLTGAEVLSYGADDTICTAALFNHFKIRTELENTWDLINEIEVKPAYLTAYAFTKGTNFSLQRMKALEELDKKEYDNAWKVVREHLIKHGWEGTVTPNYTEMTPASIKEACQIVLGTELVTRVRTPSKLAKLVEQLDHPDAPLLAQCIEDNNLRQLNALVGSRFSGEPQFDLNSPKQMKNLLYNVLGLPVRLVNSCTQNERINKPDLAEAVYKHKKLAHGSGSEPPLTSTEKGLLKAKATCDDTAVDFALRFDMPDSEVLRAIRTMKTADTKAKMYYRPYSEILHWRDRKIHAQINQCATVTRRWSSSSPNLQQLPKTKGVVFRECFTPHKRGAVICSVDYSGQEIRLQAGLSRDEAMLSCYLGDDLKDMHSITAAGAMSVVWSSEVYEDMMKVATGNNDYDRFLSLLHHEDKRVASTAKNLRNLAKQCNFGSAYGCTAPKMQELMVTDLPTASGILEAKLEKFSGFEQWKFTVEERAKELGYIATELGGRRHLQKAMTSENKWEQSSAARQASNFKIQSAGAELCKKTLTRLWDSGIFFRLDAVFIAVIHDEVVWSVHRNDAFESIQTVWEAVSQPYTADFPVPFLGSISIGSTFGTQIELGEKPNRELTEATLDQLLSSQHK